MEENESENDLRFAVCRRCPKAYHQKCLPRKIGFEDDEEKGIIQRAWEGLLPSKRILIYCLKHEINDELGTPKRNHIKFSSTEDRRRRNIFELQSSRQNLNPARSPREVTGTKARSQTKPLRQNVKEDQITSGSNPLKRVKGKVLAKKFASGPVRRATEKVDRTSSAGENKLGDQLYNFYSRSGLREEIVTNKQVVQKEQMSELQLDAESEKRLKHLMRASTYAVTMKEILEKHKGPSTYSYFSREAFDKNITLGKVEATVEAVRTALEKLESGASVEEAKDICESRVLTNVLKWKDKLKVYLAPFLYGMRYTSFGRHFTKVDKLEQIVDKLHWYVRNGDMIVDFCCGSNDFSCLLKTKLEETGKKCSFKNFDILQAKNDFNFVQKDWFEVTAKEVAPGSKLIMGLNPPFGVKAALANKFIDKALEFRPKLLVLIAPPETQRLDDKKTPYDLIWEDTELLSGKSFYLPGSVDENNKQLEDWNVTTPPLYLWSRHDWTSRVKEIARKRGHVSQNPNQYKGQEKSLEKPASEAVPMEIEEFEEFGSRRLRASEILKRPSPQSYGGCRKDYSDDSTKGRGRGQSEEETEDSSSRKDYRDNSRRCFNSRGQSEERTGEQYRGKAESLEPRGGVASEQQNNTVDFQPDVPGSGLPFEPPGFGIMDSDISDMARLYSYNEKNFSPGTDGIGYSPLVNDTSVRDSEMRSLIRNYGRQEPDPFTNHNNHRHFSSLPSATSGDFGAPAASASFNDWLNTSAMERYAPRPDELNHPRTNNAGLDNIYNPRVDQRAGRQLQPRPPPGSLGFAYGSPQAFATNSSSGGGWIDD
ncbi:unnamed protein product [Rhodiola kirilowii]